ncbi:phenylalanine--tRNA ligase, mitochondrial-like isoform X2 [Dendronephthya gigantea]|uniref:phenylalanine--tRNA ligase, mitochondrial-like isoform X2 n=1 Tax=Dendronephthya gigantea TaxID=151771 RepID=UPI001069F739|nr:phenylalanine--tRNA ligase, mitochondrial-like isoform X2 [Dendronephthya gigantea]
MVSVLQKSRYLVVQKNCLRYFRGFEFIYGKINAYKYLSTISSTSFNRVNNEIIVLGQSYRADEMTNITPSILTKVDRKLHNLTDHPLKILKDKIHKYMYATHRTRWGSPVFTMIDDVSPVVTTYQNFDSLLVPSDHTARSKNDNYYINKDILLRAHTTAHEQDLLKMGLDAWILTGDVYRRDEIDKSHYPVFHQMEGVRVFVKHELFQNNQEPVNIFSHDKKATPECQAVHTKEAVKLVENNLKETLTNLVEHLCKEKVKTRWVEAYFPFTHPSWEMEIRVENDWMELLGCGILQHDILKNAGAENKIGWAFGIGLERLAMKLFQIPDIRLFWSKDERFLSQFRENKVELIDEFVHPRTERLSHCYRITYRSMEKTFRDEEVNEIQDFLRKELHAKLGIELRG